MTLPLPPKPDRRISRIRLSSPWLPMNWLRHSTQGVRRSRTSRAGVNPAHPAFAGRSTVKSKSNSRPGVPAHPGGQPYGTTRTLVGWNCDRSRHHVPTPLRSTIITRFFATTRALTPAGPFLAACPGSLIHVTRTSHHSVSNHLRFSSRRVPLPQRWPLYFVRASLRGHQLARTADRIEFTWSVFRHGHRYGLVVHFQLLSTRGYRPDAVTFSFWPSSVGQVRDFHPAVPMHSQAHDRAALAGAVVLPTRRGIQALVARGGRTTFADECGGTMANHALPSASFASAL